MPGNEKLRMARMAKGYSQEYVGRVLLSTTQQAYSYIERGHTHITPEREQEILNLINNTNSPPPATEETTPAAAPAELNMETVIALVQEKIRQVKKEIVTEVLEGVSKLLNEDYPKPKARREKRKRK